MSNKKKNKKNVNSSNTVNIGIIIGLLSGVVLGTIFLFVFDNLFLFAVTPICGLFLSLLIAPLFDKKKKASAKTLKKAKN